MAKRIINENEDKIVKKKVNKRKPKKAETTDIYSSLDDIIIAEAGSDSQIGDTTESEPKVSVLANEETIVSKEVVQENSEEYQIEDSKNIKRKAPANKKEREFNIPYLVIKTESFVHEETLESNENLEPKIETENVVDNSSENVNPINKISKKKNGKKERLLEKSSVKLESASSEDKESLQESANIVEIDTQTISNESPQVSPEVDEAPAVIDLKTELGARKRGRPKGSKSAPLIFTDSVSESNSEESPVVVEDSTNISDGDSEPEILDLNEQVKETRSKKSQGSRPSVIIDTESVNFELETTAAPVQDSPLEPAAPIKTEPKKKAKKKTKQTEAEIEAVPVEEIAPVEIITIETKEVPPIEDLVVETPVEIIDLKEEVKTVRRGRPRKNVPQIVVNTEAVSEDIKSSEIPLIESENKEQKEGAGAEEAVPETVSQEEVPQAQEVIEPIPAYPKIRIITGDATPFSEEGEDSLNLVKLISYEEVVVYPEGYVPSEESEEDRFEVPRLIIRTDAVNYDKLGKSGIVIPIYAKPKPVEASEEIKPDENAALETPGNQAIQVVETKELLETAIIVEEVPLAATEEIIEEVKEQVVKPVELSNLEDRKSRIKDKRKKNKNKSQKIEETEIIPVVSEIVLETIAGETPDTVKPTAKPEQSNKNQRDNRNKNKFRDDRRRHEPIDEFVPNPDEPVYYIYDGDFRIKEAKESKMIRERQELEKTEPVKIVREYFPVNPKTLYNSNELKDNTITGTLSEVEKFFTNELAIDSSSRILVGVSGGVDSVVLLDLLAQLADKYKFCVFVAHFNHNLRGDESDADEAFVKELAKTYGFPYYTANGKVAAFAEKNSMSIETAARFLRYNFFERTSRNLNADYVATAHTSDDSAETFLMNLVRGAGLTGLSGIPTIRQFIKDVLLIRPMINFKKSKLIDYANARGIVWQEDASNASQNYTRNKVRLDLIPKLQEDYSPAIVDVINRTAHLLNGADKFVKQYVKNNLPNVLTDILTDRFSIKIPIFNTFDEFIQGEFIQAAINKYFRLQPPPLNVIDRILKLRTSFVGAVCEITPNLIAVKDREVIIIAKKKKIENVNIEITGVGKYEVGSSSIVLKEYDKKAVEFTANPNIEFLDMESLPEKIILRNWAPGDYFTPLGMKGIMKISDFLTNEKIPTIDRQSILVLATEEEVIWVVGIRINDKYKVTKQTTQYLKAEFKINDK